MSRCTRCREVAMQICPEWENVPHAPTDAAARTSTSGSTISAELPPSSRWARFRCCPASAPTARPARVEPVNAMTRTAGSTTSASPTSAPPGSTCSTPAGSPASAKIRANMAPPLIAVRGSGLRITALPSARAGATARMARIVGTLNGAMTPTTPAGTRRANDSRGAPVRSSSPYGCEGSAAASKHSAALVCTWKSPNGWIAPDSRASQPLISSALASRTSPALRSTRARSSNVAAAHACCAATARTAAVCTSAGVARPTGAITSPVAGSTASYVPPDPSVHAPVQTLPSQAPSSSSPISFSCPISGRPHWSRPGEGRTPPKRSAAGGAVALLVLLARPARARRVARSLLGTGDRRGLRRLGRAALLRRGVQRGGGVLQVLGGPRCVETLDRELRSGARRLRCLSRGRRGDRSLRLPRRRLGGCLGSRLGSRGSGLGSRSLRRLAGQHPRRPLLGGGQCGRLRLGLLGGGIGVLFLLGLHLEVEQEADRLLLDAVEHRVEHVEALALVLHDRVAVGHRAQVDAGPKVVHLVEVLTPLAVQHREQHPTLQLAHDLRAQRGLALVVGPVHVVEQR